MIKRRRFIGLMPAVLLSRYERVLARQTPSRPIRRIRTNTLEVAYEDSGPENGIPVLLMHGFPYDPRAYDEVVPLLASAGYRALVPYLRGYGPTRFLSAATLRSGQQAALGRDLIEFMDALKLQTAALVGFDWGGRAACVVSALWPERVRCLVSVTGYTIQDIAASAAPADPEQEHRLWYHIISIRNGAARDYKRTGTNCANFCGGCGRRTGNSTMRLTNARLSRSTIRISSMSSFTPIVTGMAMPPETLR